MTNRSQTELLPGFRRAKMSEIKGSRTRHTITMNPNKVNPGEDLYIDIPKLKPHSCLVPGSFHLLFDFKNMNTKSWFLNNLSRLLVERLVVKLAGETVYDNTGESVLGVYKDLWLPKSVRDQMVGYGIGPDNLRKLMSKDDSGASSGDAEKVADALMLTIHGVRMKVRLDKILGDHGLYAPFEMYNNFRYVISLPKASDVMVAQSSETVDGYTLENLELEYETIDNTDIASEITSLYTAGRSLSYEHVTLMKSTEWMAGSTLINEHINLPRKSMKGIVIMFTNKTRTNSEEYVYPNIKSVKLTIEGVPNAVFSQGIPKSRFYDEAKRLFSGKENTDQFITIQKFYRDAFALAIDLRSIEDRDSVGTGKRIVNTQSGILIEITKKVTVANVVCQIFVLSDGLVNMVNKNLKSIQYLMDHPFNMLIVGMTGCGKTWYLLRMLEDEYFGFFDYIVLLCPTFSWNKTYTTWKYTSDPDFIPVDCSQDDVEIILEHIVRIFKGSKTLIVLDDCASGQPVKNRTSELVKLAFNARHYNLSTIVITQQLTAITKPYRENISKLVTFYNPNKTDMKVITDDYLGGLDRDAVIGITEKLKENKYARLEIMLRHPYAYKVVIPKSGLK